MSIVGSQQRTLLELLGQLRQHWRRDRNLPARIQNLLARQRSFGARDRRLYRELIYTTLRYLPWVEPELDRNPDLAVQMVAWLAADSPATERFRAAVVPDWPACSPHVAERAAVIAGRIVSPSAPLQFGADALPPVLPEWFRDHCPAAFEPEQIDALLARAPLWIRLQTDEPAAVAAEFEQLGWRSEPSTVLPSAWRILNQPDVTKSRAYETGQIEIQDLGSQMLLESAGIESGGRWLDACAGAGGKTLQLAAFIGPTGQVDASDIRPEALRELAVRASRAGLCVTSVGGRATAAKTDNAARTRARFARLRIVTTPESTYDGVLVDAPCSGSGTWRRAPHLKWSTSPLHIENAAAKQRDLLASLSERVRPGGRLVYATCSLSRRENDEVVAAFLSTHADFTCEAPARTFGATASETGLTFLAARNDSDGFFVSSMRRRAEPAARA